VEDRENAFMLCCTNTAISGIDSRGDIIGAAKNRNQIWRGKRLNRPDAPRPDEVLACKN
jgi:hypothetical protein